MSLSTYKILHLTGVLLLFFALGGMTLTALARGAEVGDPPGEGDDAKPQKPLGWPLSSSFHGVALLVVIVSGFGMLAKAKLSMGGWVYGKLAIWLLLGAAAAPLKRLPARTARPLWFVLPVLGALAAFLAVTKPGM